MRVVFMGSGAFAIPCLEALLARGHEVAAVVTQPDKEKGRGYRFFLIEGSEKKNLTVSSR